MLSEAKHLCISLGTNAGILRYAQNDGRFSACYKTMTNKPSKLLILNENFWR